ncbi:hypothetical protein [Maribellus sp. YY47]|uniref:hypothetical protein n=1 Tax=Maribellus sp. YY47 TaxID=2929486 RepID=UPI002001C1C6|nr:hypothetical protein [Maribellus sp. YY47]MCK3682645.1 hypothetical protein [Maribellus sp. YY47]
MKSITLLIRIAFMAVLCLISATTWAQAPEGIIYQAEARNQIGDLIANSSLEVKVTILKESAQGNVVWEGNHKVITNNYGMFVLVIGTGESSGMYNFEEIDWGSAQHFLNVKVKTEESAGWIDMGTSQFLSVPYALHAKTAGSLTGVELKSAAKDGVPSQTWSLFGNSKTDPDKDVLGTTDSKDLVMVTDNIERLRIQSNGNINLARSLDVGEDLSVKQNVYLNTASGETVNNGPLSVTNNSPTVLTGTLDVEGATHLKNTLEVDGTSDLNNQLNVNNASPTYLSGTLTVNENTLLHQNLEVKNNAMVEGNTNLKKTLTVDGTTNLMNKVNAGGQVTIKYNNPEGDASDYDEYALQIEGSKHGIGIKSTAILPSRQDNFITFFDRQGSAKGRIEGNSGLPGLILSVIYDILKPEPFSIKLDGKLPGTPLPAQGDQSGAKPLKIEPDGIDFTSEYAVELYSIGVDFTKSVIVFGVNCVGALVGEAILGDIDDVVWSGVDVVTESLQWGIFEAFHTIGLGVAFESGGADYAEWLEKKEETELLLFGEVVGVNGGVISKDFKKAEKFMVITQNPTVIGAMPEGDNEKKYEKVAFMGQVQVRVIGKVKKGDYILPSGNQDGMAIAVDPKNMAVGDYARIIGIAWGESDGKEIFSFVNTAVGINTNDLTRVIENMQSTLNDMQLALAEVNPNYNPQLYAVNGNAEQANNQITTSPSVNTLMANKSGALEAQTVEEAIMKIKDYAYMNNPNLDLSQFPYLEEMFNNPTAETAQAMVDHYQMVLERLISLAPTAQKN